jgi:hypothetical protein
MAAYRIHIPLDRHEGRKTGTVRSCTRGTRIEAPEGEFADLTPGAEYSRLDTGSDSFETDAPAADPDPSDSDS